MICTQTEGQRSQAASRPSQIALSTLCAAAVALIALSAAAPAHAQKAEVMHWWTSGGESAAIKEVADAYTKAGGTWVDSAVAGGPAARAALMNRITGGSPPTAGQFNTSKQYHELIAEGLLTPLDEVAARDNWDQMLPAPIISSIKVKGHYYAAPLNIHMPAWIWYSKAALQKAGVAEPKSTDEFFAALDKLKAAGITPLALGGQSWQEALTFNATLMHVGGRDLYLKFYRDKDAAAVDSPAFRKVLTSYRKLKDYTDAGAPGRNWNDATAMLITGKAGFQIMGDWAKGEFSAAKQTAGKEYGCIPGFGPASPYMIGGDVFVFPKAKDAEAAKAQMLLATVMTSKATQVAFNVKKGSVPIRTDVDGSAMDLCAQLGLQIMKDASRHLASANQMLAPDAIGAVEDVVTKFFNAPNPNVDETVKALQVAVKR